MRIFSVPNTVEYFVYSVLMTPVFSRWLRVHFPDNRPGGKNKR